MRFLVRVILTVVAVLLIGACQEDHMAGPDEGITMEDIVWDPGPLVGQEVAVSAEVREVFPPYAFTLESGHAQPVLIVSPDSVRVAEASVVQAIGRVVSAPVDTGDVRADVAAFVRDVAGDDYGHAIVAREVVTLEEPDHS